MSTQVALNSIYLTMSEIKTNLVKYQNFIRLIREFFYSRNVVEVKTPSLLSTPTSDVYIDSIGVEVNAQDQVQTQVQIYGSQLMTPAERTEYQSKMRALKTDKERDAFRLDHHDKMKVRAAEKGDIIAQMRAKVIHCHHSEVFTSSRAHRYRARVDLFVADD